MAAPGPGSTGARALARRNNAPSAVARSLEIKYQFDKPGLNEDTSDIQQGVGARTEQGSAVKRTLETLTARTCDGASRIHPS